MNKIYYDIKSKQDVELVELDDNKRFMIIRPVGEVASVRLDFQKGFFPSVYLDTYFIEKIKHKDKQGVVK